MEASVVRGAPRVAFGVPHCQLCLMVLGQPVPIIKTSRGYALFCEQCALGHNAPAVRVRDAKRLEITLERDEAADSSAHAEEE